MFDFSGSKKLILFIIEEWKLMLIFTVLFLLYFYYTSTFDFFEKKGISFMKPTIFLGNLGPRLMAKVSFHQYQLQIYNNFKGKRFGGMFEGRKPVLYVTDKDLIKSVTIRDFEYFVDRNSITFNEPRYLSRSLLNLKGSVWKGVRSTLTPTFSSARLRNMLPLIEVCSDQLVQFLKQYDKKELEMKDTMGHFTLEVIGACAFGIRCDALSQRDSHFVQIAKKFNYMPKLKRIMVFFLLMCWPRSWFKYLSLSFFNQEYTGQLMNMLQATKAERRHSDDKRNDFLQLMIDALEKEKLDSKSGATETYLDDDTIDAQSLLFLIAGYETSSTLLSFATHVLATRPELQQKLRAHVQQKAAGRPLSYELLAELDYLEAFLLETLRMYPPIARVDRTCSKTYPLPGSNCSLDPGDVVAIPVYGIHMDPEVYPDPEVFRPERFLGDEKKERPSHLFLAFGVGPRNCIGLRFAMISAKMAMVSLLRNYQFSASPKTEDPVKFEKRGFLLMAEKGLWVNIEAI